MNFGITFAALFLVLAGISIWLYPFFGEADVIIVQVAKLLAAAMIAGGLTLLLREWQKR